MTNAERMMLLKRARLEIQRVRDDLDLVSATCPKCDEVYFVDEAAFKLDQELAVLTASLSSWIEQIAKRPASSERLSSEPPLLTANFCSTSPTT